MSSNDAGQIVTRSEEETRDLGERLGRQLRRGDIVLLNGELGAGKTCLAQGIARGLDIAQPVTSPSFVLMNEYAGRETLFHVDLYRMNSVEELDDLGLWDYAERGVLVMEWPERGAEILPGDGLTVKLAYGSGERIRSFAVEPRGPRGEAIAQAIGVPA